MASHQDMPGVRSFDTYRRIQVTKIKNYNGENPLSMQPDPFDGKTFILPETECTDERSKFFKRMNEILGFMYVSLLCYDEYRKHFNKIIPKLTFREKTPIKIEWKGSKSAVLSARKVISLSKEAFDILPRQIFVMSYGSFETYLFQLFERSFPIIDITDKTLELSIEILMKRRWDGKFSKMAHTFDVDYKAAQLIDHFSKLTMDFNGTIIKNPLTFLDELVQIRHKIVHASSFFEKGRKVFIDINFVPEFFFFLYHLTAYIDGLFVERFGYETIKVNPAEV